MEEQTFEIWESQHFIGARIQKIFESRTKDILTFWKIKYLHNTEKGQIILEFLFYLVLSKSTKLETARLYFPLHFAVDCADNLFSYC